MAPGPITDGTVSGMDYIQPYSVKNLSEEDETIVATQKMKAMTTGKLEEFMTLIWFHNPEYRLNGLQPSLWTRSKGGHLRNSRVLIWNYNSIKSYGTYCLIW